MRPRPGITLVEVLVAIFIMGVGMIALLALFPLGAVNIARALTDDRCSQVAANASAIANAMDLRHDPNIMGSFNVPRSGFQGQLGNNQDPNKPSSPVLVDAFGVGAGFGPTLAGTLAADSISRVSPTYVPGGNDPQASYWFSLLNDLNFDTNGTAIAPGSVVQRTGRFTWAYLLRRPRLGDASVVELTVVVYANRSLVAGTGETAYTATANVGGNQLLLNYPGAKPNIRNGSWILDITADPDPNPNISPVVRGFFYRVVDSTEAGAGQLTLEVQTPLRGQSNTFTSIVVMENVAEVFDRGTGNTP